MKKNQEKIANISCFFNCLRIMKLSLYIFRLRSSDSGSNAWETVIFICEPGEFKLTPTEGSILAGVGWGGRWGRGGPGDVSWFWCEAVKTSLRASWRLLVQPSQGIRGRLEKSKWKHKAPDLTFEDWTGLKSKDFFFFVTYFWFLSDIWWVCYYKRS